MKFWRIKKILLKVKLVKVSVFLIGTKDVQWEFVHGLLENAIYGGRVDNCFDLRVLQSYLKQFFNSSVIDVLNERNKKSIFPYSISLPNSCSILVGRNNDLPCISCTCTQWIVWWLCYWFSKHTDNCNADCLFWQYMVSFLELAPIKTWVFNQSIVAIVRYWEYGAKDTHRTSAFSAGL